MNTVLELDAESGRRSSAAFFRNYLGCVDDVLAYWTPAMQEELAVHCRGWAPGSFDFRTYLVRSADRYLRAYRCLGGMKAESRICDIGGFFGVFSLALLRTGYEDVTMTETLSYYGSAFSPLFGYLRSSGLRIVDYDPFAVEAFPGKGFDAITVMAVIEHYPHSLRRFLGNVRRMCADDGLVYIEVPNLAYWPKRMAMLRGHTPLVHAAEIYESEVPFIGHHHEYTIDELRHVLRRAGLEIRHESFYSYSLEGSWYRRILTRPLETLAMAIMPQARECIAVSATPATRRDS